MYNLPVNYNKLTPLQRAHVRQQYINEQANRCWFCKASLDKQASSFVRSASINLTLFPPRFLEHPIHLHHNHNTGMTIGAVHARCNAYLWQYKGE